ncbi:copper chaperone PCu(A)C [Actinoplanes sp. NPDC026623]|uniref:copper chaperone PCu(A)C n=1 Tax=Actinoplanes sp. NPDC026623 TaxID=3155610 RepID=UPI0033D77F0A
MGANARVGSILLRSVHIEAPPDARYRVGDDARVWFTALNQGTYPDVLRSLTSPYARTGQVRWDDDCDGTATVVPALVLRPAKPNLAQSPPGVPPFDAYHARLVGLNRAVLAGTTIPVTFTFDDAGSVTVDALVQPGNVVRPEPSNRCHGGASATPSAA